jgi:hypothetical protein
MHVSLKAPNWKLAIGLPSLVLVACIAIVLSPIYQTNKQSLSLPIIFDLLVTAPILYYLVIRKTKVAYTTVIRVFLIGLLVASWLMEKNGPPILIGIKHWLAPILEVVVIGSLCWSFRSNRSILMTNKGLENDFLLFCQKLMIHVLGNKRAGLLIASEISVIYYALSFGKTLPIDKERTFSYHQKNGILLILGTFLSLFMIETTGMHFVFLQWSKTAAWILTLLSTYSCLQLFAHMRAVKARPIFVGEHELKLRNGLAGDAIVPYHLIEKLELNKLTPNGRTMQHLGLIKGMEGHNCVLYLKEDLVINGLFGIEKTCNTILFNCDQPNELDAAIENHIRFN